MVPQALSVLAVSVVQAPQHSLLHPQLWQLFQAPMAK
jgi:hypothetical protein